MAAAYRCSNCSLIYPSRIEFQTCLQCGGKTWFNSTNTDDPITDDHIALLKERKAEEAESERKHREFEEYCEARDRRQIAEAAHRLETGTTIYADDV